MNETGSSVDRDDEEAPASVLRLLEAGIPEFAVSPALGDAALRRADRRRTVIAVGGSISAVAVVAAGVLIAAPAHKTSNAADLPTPALTTPTTRLDPPRCPVLPPTTYEFAASAQRVPGAGAALSPARPVVTAVECGYGTVSTSPNTTTEAPGTPAQVLSLVTDLARLPVQPGSGDHSCPANMTTAESVFILQFADGTTLTVGQNDCHWLTNGLVFSTTNLQDEWIFKNDAPTQTPTPPTTPPIDQAADDLSNFIRNHYMTSAMSVIPVPSANTLIVYRVPKPGLDDVIRTREPHYTIRFIDSPLDQSQQYLLEQRIQHDIDSGYWSARKIGLTGTAAQSDGTITLYDNDPPADTAILKATYGAANVTVVQGQ